MMSSHSIETAAPESAKQHLAGLIAQAIDAAGNNADRAIRLEVPIERVNAVAWLQAQGQRSRGYWRNRNGDFELAGIGKADVITGEVGTDYDALFDHLHTSIAAVHPNLRYLGGMRFSARRPIAEKWKPFGAYRFVLPRFEILNREHRSYLACNILRDVENNLAELKDSLFDELHAMEFPPAYDANRPKALLGRSDLPDEPAWASLVESALSEIRSGRFNKLVLARETIFHSHSSLDPALILARLVDAAQHCYRFCFQPKPGAAFLGASPERLFKRRGRHLETEALAGTRARGETDAEDQQLSDALLNSDKDRREHRIVVDAIRAQLEARCHGVHADDEMSLLKLSRSQHLLTRLEGLLAHGDSDASLLRDLHPSPAVGGQPRDAAITWLDTHEPFDRGWYAGPVGWVSHDEAEVAVGIRSGLVAGDTLSLYSGAGIVEGSTPKDEWAEVENKMSNFLHPLQHG